MAERVLQIGTRKHTKVICTDEPELSLDPGGACHNYEVVSADGVASAVPSQLLAKLHFQNGPVKEVGVNGCFHEDLLAIVIDRLEHFQRGEYACEMNSSALYHLDRALSCLQLRTKERQHRGVEGTSKQ